MTAPKPISSERSVMFKYTKTVVLDALGLNSDKRVTTMTINQYGELEVTVSTGPMSPDDDDDPAPRAPISQLWDT